MSRDHRKLRVFTLADELAIEVYRTTAEFPQTERFALQLQIRRAAVSVPSNIVEGSARRTTRDYVQFLSVATGSAAETLYLLSLGQRLGWISATNYKSLESRYTELLKSLKKLTYSLENQP